MIINSQRTIYGLELQANTMINIPYIPRINTTLNEKHNLLVNESVGNDTTYSIKYLAIGRGGSPVANNIDGYTYSQHSVTDAALFDQIPFIVRPVASDISSSERNKYRLRVMKTISGTDYYLYYLKKILPSDITTDTYNMSLGHNGITKLSLFNTNTSKHLNPTPVAGVPVNSSSGTYISKMIKVNFTLTRIELDEITNAVDIIYGPGSHASLTELAICGGLDKIMPGGEVEAINTQIYYHVGVSLMTRLDKNVTTGYIRAIELGSSEVLYV